MDLVKLPSILWRWRWIVTAVVLVAVLSLGLHVRTTRTMYEAPVRLQITAPQGEDVSVLDTNSRASSSLRDDLVLVRNDLLAVVRSPEVYARTGRQLNLKDQDTYGISVRPIQDSNFVDLVASAQTPERARAIANAHAAQAIQYYGELRAKPAATAKEIITAQLERARVALPAATAVPGDKGVISADAQQARDTYTMLLKKQAEAALAVETASHATYIQIAEPAVTATRPGFAKAFGPIVLLTLVGSLGLGVLLALLLESLFQRKGFARTTSIGKADGSAGGIVLPATAAEQASETR